MTLQLKNKKIRSETAFGIRAQFENETPSDYISCVIKDIMDVFYLVVINSSMPKLVVQKAHFTDFSALKFAFISTVI